MNDEDKKMVAKLGRAGDQGWQETKEIVKNILNACDDFPVAMKKSLGECDLEEKDKNIITKIFFSALAKLLMEIEQDIKEKGEFDEQF